MPDAPSHSTFARTLAPGRRDRFRLGQRSTSAQEDSFRITRRAVWSWALFDLANTIFSINIISLQFSLWVVQDQGAKDSFYMIANSISMGLIFISASFLGALSDQTPRRLPLLIATTLGCCSLTAMLGLGGLYTSLGIFILANFLFQAGLIFYDTLLPSVSTRENQGWVSGLGLGVGYIGSMIGIAIGLTVLHFNPDGRVWVFRLTALAFFIFALPCFLFVRERPRPDSHGFTLNALKAAIPKVKEAVATARQSPDIKRFLISHLLYADAANTMIASLGIYATKQIGFTDQEVQFVLLIGIVTAIGGALFTGRLVDTLGPKRALLRVLCAWIVLAFIIAAIGIWELPKELFWFVAVLAGLTLGGTWSADRPFIFRLSKPNEIGQIYGLYAMVGRFASMLGPLVWSLIVDGLGYGRPVAIMALGGFIVFALIVLLPVDDTPRNDPEPPPTAAPAPATAPA
jgi:UMF1 family MFS transporter